ncbi:5-formyltetrahydrofolate cyclo-ligase, partial [Phenylobacterium sp.]|uniref:5-formyltetrahydrofolate cyclo-ligase n=1 Tax=Phenylobacterium sp. TaxID=1871053 RepID=UPI002735908B
ATLIHSKGAVPGRSRGTGQNGAHLVIQVEGIQPSFTALAAPPPFAYAGEVIPEPTKTRLRAELRRRRRKLAAAAPDAAQAAAQHLMLERLPAFACFSGYHAVGAEIDPSPLIRRLARTGAFFALPVCEAHEQPLVFRAWDERDTPQPDLFGVPAPPRHAPVLHPDLIVCPLLAFDRKGGRLGQGGGHYDRTIAELRAHKPVFVLGLAYAGQEVEAVPCEAHDQRLDAILTESGYIHVRKD